MQPTYFLLIILYKLYGRLSQIRLTVICVCVEWSKRSAAFAALNNVGNLIFVLSYYYFVQWRVPHIMSVLIIIVFNFSLSPVLWFDAHLHWFFSHFIWRYSIKLNWHQVFPYSHPNQNAHSIPSFETHHFRNLPKNGSKNRPKYDGIVKSIPRSLT